jgi:hypothetical protein
MLYHDPNVFRASENTLCLQLVKFILKNLQVVLAIAWGMELSCWRKNWAESNVGTYPATLVVVPANDGFKHMIEFQVQLRENCVFHDAPRWSLGSTTTLFEKGGNDSVGGSTDLFGGAIDFLSSTMWVARIWHKCSFFGINIGDDVVLEILISLSITRMIWTSGHLKSVNTFDDVLGSNATMLSTKPLSAVFRHMYSFGNKVIDWGARHK